MCYIVKVLIFFYSTCEYKVFEKTACWLNRYPLSQDISQVEK